MLFANNSFAYSYEPIIIAQAGATFAIRGAKPAIHLFQDRKKSEKEKDEKTNTMNKYTCK